MHGRWNIREPKSEISQKCVLTIERTDGLDEVGSRYWLCERAEKLIRHREWTMTGSRQLHFIAKPTHLRKYKKTIYR